MKLSGNTIFITGGGSGIGRGLAEALHKLGNKVIIAGRRRSHLDAAIAANPGMEAVELDITDPTSINQVAAKLIAEHPDLNVLINNAGIMQPDAAAGKIDDALMVATISTNLMGRIRMTSALIEHLKGKSDAVVAYTSSVLGFVPLAATAIYSSTKAAVHSYTQSLRFQLEDSGVEVIELMPPAVQTDMTSEFPEEVRMITTDELVRQTFAALEAGKLEIRPGQSNQFAFLRRLAPNFINRQLWKASKEMVPAIAA